MVRNHFVSKNRANADSWIWPHFAKSESEIENIYISLAPLVTLFATFPGFAFIILFIFWIAYHRMLLSLSDLKLICLLSGSLWFALWKIFGVKVILNEFVYSSLYRISNLNHLDVLLTFLTRQIFFITLGMIFWIYYNRRQVDPDKVHFKVYKRQSHERMRLLRPWHMRVQIPEVL